MKIEQSSLVLNTEHEASSRREVSFEYKDDFQRVLAENSAGQIADNSAVQSDSEHHLLFLLHQLITLLFRVIAAQEVNADTSGSEGKMATPTPARGEDTPRKVEWASSWRERIEEYESSRFSAHGTVRTADGQCLAFALDFKQTRHFSCETTRVEAGSFVLRDPLVVNIDVSAASLSQRRFAFDLDADGISESIPELGGGSAFLAFDRNGDGRIGNGQELFGTASGNGFSDLAKLDDDGNGWIDAADRAYAQLCLWMPGDAGEQLKRLGQEGIGALALGHVATPFTLTDANNATLGQIRHSGLYLREDGRAGTLQQVDLAV